MTDTILVTWIVGETRVTAPVPVGETLMQAAIKNGIDGIIGECGGAMSCATCHVVVVGTPTPVDDAGDQEKEMLEFAAVEPSPGSRLSCQIRASHDIDGIVLRVPQ